MVQKLFLKPLLLNQSQDDKKKLQGTLGMFFCVFWDGLMDVVLPTEIERRLADDVEFGIFLNVSVILFLIFHAYQLSLSLLRDITFF